MSPAVLPLLLYEDVVVEAAAEEAEVAAAWMIGRVSTSDITIIPGVVIRDSRRMLRSYRWLSPKKMRFLAVATGTKGRRSAQQTALVQANSVKGAVGMGRAHTGTIVPDAELLATRCL
jgi:hypothetical protein